MIDTHEKTKPSSTAITSLTSPGPEIAKSLTAVTKFAAEMGLAFTVALAVALALTLAMTFLPFPSNSHFAYANTANGEENTLLSETAVKISASCESPALGQSTTTHIKQGAQLGEGRGVYAGRDDIKINPKSKRNAIATLSTGESSYVKLKPGQHEKWIDRIEFPEDVDSPAIFYGGLGTDGISFARHFYDTLAEATDADGIDDYLIEDKYRLATIGKDEGAYVQFFPNVGALYVTGFTYETPDEYAEKHDAITESLMSVIAAFDRDYPEVFWLDDGTMHVIWENRVSAKEARADAYILLGGYEEFGIYDDPTGIWSSQFESTQDVKAAISLRDERTSELSGKVFGMSDSEKVRYFNTWLICSNSYNSNMKQLSEHYPLAYECLSALIGRTGNFGPVCEGYSRAMMVLCQNEEIPCVLEDGPAQGEAHMWNAVCIGDAWYAVDSTWNDPGVSESAKSGYENEKYLLVGTGTVIDGDVFAHSHILENQALYGGIGFTNGPSVSESAYPISGNTGAISTFKASAYKKLDIDWLNHDISAAIVSIAPQTYSGSVVTPTVKASLRGRELVSGQDFVVAFSNNVNAGQARAVLTGIGRYTGSLTVPFKISPRKISVKSTSIAKEMAYTGKLLKPSVKVVLDTKATGISPRKGTDYTITITYKNNKKVGKATVSVTVKGIGNFTGTYKKTLSFKINPKKMAIKKLDATKKGFKAQWAKANSSYAGGYQLRYCTSKAFKKSVKTVTIGKRTTTSKTVGKLKSKKRIYVQLRAFKKVGGTNYYGAWSATKSVKTN